MQLRVAPQSSMQNQFSPLDASVFEHAKRRTALLTGLEAEDGQQVSPELQWLMDHRNRTMLFRTMDLQAAMAKPHKQAQAPLPAQPTVEAPPVPVPAPRKVKHLRRVPELQQMEAVECGAACLAMILSYYKRPTSVAEMREFCGVGRDGLSALALVKAARAHGLEVQAVSLEENDFSDISLPAIIHWDFNHFLIVERWSPQEVILVDPAEGLRSVTAEEFDRHFTGIVLMPEPGPNFVARRPARGRTTLRSYLLRYARIAPGALVQILLASFLFQLFGLVTPVLTLVVVNQIIPFQLHNALLLVSIGLFLIILSQGCFPHSH